MSFLEFRASKYSLMKKYLLPPGYFCGIFLHSICLSLSNVFNVQWQP